MISQSHSQLSPTCKTYEPAVISRQSSGEEKKERAQSGQLPSSCGKIQENLSEQVADAEDREEDVPGIEYVIPELPVAIP